MKIKYKLAIAFLVTALVPIALLATFMIIQSRDLAEQEFRDASGNEVRKLDQAFTDFFAEVANNVSYLANTPALQHTDGSLTKYMDKPSQMATPTKNGPVEREIFATLQRFAQTHPGFAYVYMGTREGGYVQWPEGKTGANYDPRKRPWYINAFKTPGKVVMSGSYYWAEDDVTLYAVAKTLDTTTQKNFGVMSMDVSLNSLTDMARHASLGKGGYMMLIEDTGKVLVDAADPKHNFKMLTDLKGAGYQNLAGTQSGQTRVRLNGEDFEATVYRSPKLGWKMIALVPRSEILAQANRILWLTLGVAAAAVLAALLLGLWISGLLVNPVLLVSKGLREIAEGGGDLTRRLTAKGGDEVGQLAQRFNEFLESIQQLVARINGNAQQFKQVSEAGRQSATSVDKASNNQFTEVESMVTAVNEMSATATEVARNCTLTADAAASSQSLSESGKQVVVGTERSVRSLSEQVSQSVESIRELEAETDRINTILDVIRGIAEQTNLLALNAAIEAARAGEHGRGFAVVADEVRNLAQRTQQSTKEINSLLEQLNTRTHQVVENMDASKSMSESAVEFAVQALETFDSIKSSIDQITDMTTQIASAAEQQHQVTDGLNANIEAIHEAANAVKNESSLVAQNADKQAELATELTTLMKQFNV